MEKNGGNERKGGNTGGSGKSADNSVKRECHGANSRPAKPGTETKVREESKNKIT